MKLSLSTRQRGFTLIEIMIVVSIIGLLLGVALPAFMKSREQATKQVCIENLSQIESAKQVWGVENGKKNGSPASAADLIGPNLYMKKEPLCPGGGRYDYTTIGSPALCSAEGHSL